MEEFVGFKRDISKLGTVFFKCVCDQCKYWSFRKAVMKRHVEEHRQPEVHIF